MKAALALILAFFIPGVVSTLAAADGNQETQAKRVSSVTWNAQTGKLEWVVQNGVERDGEFVVSSEEAHYEITPEEAMMAFQGQQRGFTDREAAWLQGLLHVLTIYCAESTIWWDQGQGVPLDHGNPIGRPPAEHPAQPDIQPHKVIQPPQRKAPGAVQLVAVNRIL